MHTWIMAALVLALPWVAAATPKAGPATPVERADQVAQGKALNTQLGCAACHHVVAPDGRGTIGPQYTGLYGSTRTLADGRAVKIDADYVRRAILTPMAELAQGYPPSMPAYQGRIDDEQLDALVAFIASLGVSGDPPAGAGPEKTAPAPEKTAPAPQK